MSDNNNVTPPTQVHFKIGPENSVSNLAKEEGAIAISINAKSNITSCNFSCNIIVRIIKY